MVARVVLTGRHVRLEPLVPDHVHPLLEAASEDRRSYRFTTVPAHEASMARYVAEALHDEAGGVALPFAIRLLAEDRVVGTTRFLDLASLSFPSPGDPGTAGREPAPEEQGTGKQGPVVAEIGSTWLAASVQRCAVNTEAKFLLLTHGFEVWGCARITVKTDARNVVSRRAIERLGACFEGIRRAHCLASDGTLRDSAYYSILREEWPGVKGGLSARMGRRD
jgi:RimJ/RimL family protein N-acetyltransferase